MKPLYLSEFALIRIYPLTVKILRYIIYFVHEIFAYVILLLGGTKMEKLDETIEVTKLFQEVICLLKHSMSKVFEDTNITPPQGMVIRILSHHDKMKISELSNKLGLSNSTVSGIVDRLEKQGMVQRERSLEDKRVVYVNVSPEFYDMHKGFHKRADENIKNIMNKGTPEDLHKVMDGLSTLKKLLSPDSK
jgi:DNA-binding MarR family transcriptional regulator